MSVAPNPDHPAKFSQPILDQMAAIVSSEAERLHRRPTLLDPFAGVGRIHKLERWAETTGVEIEPEWAACHSRTEVGDATNLRFPDESFDIVATSIVYPGRMTDHHNARDASERKGYKFSLRRDPSPGSTAVFGWKSAPQRAEHKRLHAAAYRQIARVLTRRGLFVLNISNHVQDGDMQPIVEWHVSHLLEHGWWLLAAYPIVTRRMKNGANRDARAECEMVICLRPSTGEGIRDDWQAVAWDAR